MERKNFSETFVNYSGGQPFTENGYHMTTTEQELIDWFLACKCSTGWQKISDIKITELSRDNKEIDRTDLVMKIIKPRIFTVGEEITPIFFDPLPDNSVAPPLVKGQRYTIKRIFVDSKGNQHLDLGLKSKFNYIKSFETQEQLPDGDKIHWCHPGRVELVKNKEKEEQKIVLGHLNAVTNRTLYIPVIALNKSYSWTRLYEEVEKLSDTGKAFIKEMMENVEEMRKFLERK